MDFLQRFSFLVYACVGALLLAASQSVWADVVPVLSQQAYVKASNPHPTDAFGTAVAIWGNILVVGADRESSGAVGLNGVQTNFTAPRSGAAYVFVRNGTNWSQQAYLKASNTRAEAHFGWSVAAAENIVVVGSPFETSGATGVSGNQEDTSATNSGAAYVFVREGTNWTQQAYLKSSSTRGGTNYAAYFGLSVGVYGNTIVVGAIGESSNATGVNGNQTNNAAVSSGAAFVFVRNGSNWSQQAYLKASNTGGGDGFGYKVAIWEDTIVVGAPYESSPPNDPSANNLLSSGAAYVFTRTHGTNWSQQAFLKASNAEGGVPLGGFPAYYGDLFGRSLAVMDNTIVVGAYREDSASPGVNGNQADNNAMESGAAYVFRNASGGWTQEAYLKAPNPGTGDYFGGSVAIGDNMVVVGAMDEDSNATGVNGNGNDNNLSNSGAAYVYYRIDAEWVHQYYVKAAKTRASDEFGVAVAAFGDAVVVGAWNESSGSTGVNGDPNNANVFGSGAAYVFSEPIFRPTLRIVPDGGAGYFVGFIGLPGAEYYLQRADKLSGPWDTITSLATPPSGAVQFHDTNTLDVVRSFYRVVRP